MNEIYIIVYLYIIILLKIIKILYYNKKLKLFF